MMNEIGSEFHYMVKDTGTGIIFPKPGTLVFSGRTAIENILGNLKNVHTALLPSYCCDSIIEPFRKAGIFVKFYPVNWKNGLKIIIDSSADILFWCNYFGFQNDIPNFEGIIIEDITHSLLSLKQFHKESDYFIASLRKWEPVNSGGYCSINTTTKLPPKEYVEQKTTAMKLKKKYLTEFDQNNKQEYLRLFNECNHWLAENYSGLSIDILSRDYLEHVDVEKQRITRISNARILYNGLKDKVQFLFPEEDMDCPLFVPILLKNRNEVRKHLIENDIYCPIHWPKPKECESNIYDMELSLICDQRYGDEDMKRIVSNILEVL